MSEQVSSEQPGTGGGPLAELAFHTATPAALDAVTVYRILALRVTVFVVEQACPYPELDGRDLEPAARWMWASSGDEVIATLRVLFDDPATARIGRVATAASARSAGIGARLMNYALAEIGPLPAIVLDAQSPLAGWYQRFGFARDGREFIEDGIAHLPMRRPAGQHR